MANILEFLRGVLTDAEIREAFQADPTGFLQRTGFGDLTGEDVAEAIAVVRRSLPEQAAAALAAFEDDDDLSAVRPQAGERELDAAARVLLYAVGQVPLGRRDAAPEAGGAPAPSPETRQSRRAERPERPERSEGAALATAAPAAPVPASEPDRPVEAAPAPVEIVLPSLSDFTETITTIVSETKARLTDVLRQAAQDAERLRADAESEVAKLREEANADREAAREYLERTRAESDAILERSKESLEDARRQGEELIVASQAETEAVRREIDARRAEIRDAERQLKERLGGIETLFRTVLRDDEPSHDAPPSDADEHP